jgi:putative transposase
MRRKLQTYAITSVTHQRKRLFQRTATAELFIATLFRYRGTGKFQLHGFVVMPDHFHALISPAPDLTIERCAQLIEGGFSFAVRDDYAGEIWQESYHAHRVIDEQDYRNQLLSIANNPTREGLNEHPHVHTAPAYCDRVDPHPSG